MSAGPGKEGEGLEDTLPLQRPVPEAPSLECCPHRALPAPRTARRGRDGRGLARRAGRALRRKVALKVIKAGMDTREVVARFESERQALALMDHPAIARVFDGGSTPEGRPYFVMEYVAGVPITEHCDTQRLSTAERLELFIEVCEGVQHAHQKAIIHRDLKPSNILVSVVDGKACPKIIDFGIAKATGYAAHREDALHRAGGSHRHARVHEPGAGGRQRTGRRHPDRRLLAGRRPVPAPDRRRCLSAQTSCAPSSLRGAAAKAEGGRAAPARAPG